MASSAPRVLVIGAGTGGLCLAHGLRRAGIEVGVFERDRTRAEGPHGFWIGIDPDGSRALHRCLPAELYDTFVASCALPIRHFNMLTEQMSEVLSLEVPPGTDPVDSEKSVNRSTLRQVMLTGLDDVVRFDRTFVSYRANCDGTVSARFADGSSVTGDVLVGADGTSSRVRRQLLPQARLEDTGLWGVTGKIPLTDRTRSLLSQKVIDGVSIFAGPRGDACVFHVVDLPWDEEGKPKDRVGGRDRELLEAWPGLRYDGTRDYIMFGFAGAAARMPRDMLNWDGERLRDLVRERTRGWHANLRRLFTEADPASCFPLNIRTSVRPPAWPPGLVTVIGDAIHTMTPGRGVGANTALRDAELLCRQLPAARDGEMTLVEAIGGYEEQMREYAFHAVERSRSRMNAGDPVYKPYVGRIVLAGRRTGMRLINRLPAVKRKIARKEQEFRGAHRST
jgi:2-polyprenyl-6-methoxyphenol hydroxylase-like FAD-dependent oxidoreductase